ncbi:MAG: extracellular solute-binding protein [Clostridiales bacterium]|nr:extracellular solute-binding protein [Clostridiales bacterium]
MRERRINIFQRIGLAAASVMICLQLAGCGEAENTTAQKEFVYVPEYQEIDSDGSSVDSVNVIGDTIYYLVNKYDETAQKFTAYLCSLKIGEEEATKVPLDIGEDASISKMNVAADGNLQAILVTYLYDDEADATNGTEDGIAEEASDSEEETGETDTDVAATEEYQPPSSQKTEVCRLSADGTIISSIDISGILENKDAYIQYMETDKDGNIYLAYDQGAWVLDKDGKELFDTEVDSWITGMFSTKDGTVMLVYYGQEGTEIRPIDLSKKGMGDAQTNIMVTPYGNYIFGKGTDKDILFSVDNTLYSYNLGDEEPVEVLNWIDCDINSNDIISFAVLEDGRILAVSSYMTEDSSTMELAFLTKKKGSEVPEKKIITYGTIYLDYEIRKRVIDFNKTNQEYRIEVKEYMSEDYDTGASQLNTDIVSGNTPDIIDLSSGSLQQYASKGILEDLYPYIDNDPEIKREDYLPNVLKAYEMDGKLYTVAPFFYINTFIAKVSDVGDRRSITLDELMEIVKNLPEDADLYDYGTKSVALMYDTMMNLDRYVNWSTGECSFNGDEFIKALEFANYFDSDFNFDEDKPGTAERLHNGKLLMIDGTISSVTEYQMYEGMFGEPMAFVGYPTDKENGSFITGMGGTLGMSVKSKNKEGVWQFIRTGLSKEYQEKENRNGGNGFPIMKSALEKQFEEAMTEDYYEDADGNKVRQAKTSWGYDDFSIEIYAATKEQVEAVRSLIESVDSLYQYDRQISTIIDEEAAAFFEGQKTAKDVADIIQSRVQIYVNENR